ncbi:MAG: ATP-dependent DNA helicase RecG [Lachnospiraceae bacterium]|nr:ATP-dependent DNA helicase RecG [Lachnospiraceae bacterium]
MKSEDKITELKGIGEKSANLFHKLNIDTLDDLLHYFPRDYETFLPPVKAGSAKAGEVCTLRLKLREAPALRRVRGLTILTMRAQDDTGCVNLTFFNMPYLKNTLKSGSCYLFRAQLQERGNGRYMEQPRIYKEEEYRLLTEGIQPRYALTKGITNQGIVRAVRQALQLCVLPEDPLPEDIRIRYGLAGYREAFFQIHFPETQEKLIGARKRFAFDEFLTFILLLRRSREASESVRSHFPMIETADTARLMEKLPYRLTNAQLRAWEEIRQDLSGENCMNRLVQGDVGSGKTVVALLGLLMCVSNGYQGAMMAPTEVLARQHYDTFCAFTEQYGLPFRPVLLTGSMKAQEKRDAYARIASGEANLVLGTHAVIQEKVKFCRLALVITDEQHRFGVRQRQNLAEKGEAPHVLVMSATPIPRTLAIILYGDLHVSVIDELPGDRLPIKNCVVGTAYRSTAYKFIAAQVKEGRQAYVVCPMVEEGEMEGLENVTDYADKLRAALPPDVQVAHLHGKMRPAEKNRVMEAFAAKNIDVLVSTTVIEVGINVPNATVMMVENAERFGLAQLHQLRGRIGRGAYQGYCIFVSGMERPDIMERLQILNRSNDGFRIADEDLRLRGPGELFGVRQSGALSFQVGDIYQDADMLKCAVECADDILKEDSGLESEKYRALRNYFEKGARNMVDFRNL